MPGHLYERATVRELFAIVNVLEMHRAMQCNQIPDLLVMVR